MANTLIGNTWYVDTAYGGTAANDYASPVGVSYVSVTATSASAVVLLADPVASGKKIELRVATSGATQIFDFSRMPLVFPNGVRVTTLTNATATLVGRELKS